MGMYTKLTISFTLKRDIPTNILEIIKYIANPNLVNENDLVIPENPFFLTSDEKRYCLKDLRGDIGFFGGHLESGFSYNWNAWQFTISCSRKNYNDEYDKFLNWIAPYIKGDRPYLFLGIQQYEEDWDPTLIYLKEGKIEYVSFPYEGLLNIKV